MTDSSACFFSIIIPTLNEEKNIGKVLSDLTRQEYKNFEVIVVDALSEDKTIDSINHYKDKLQLQILTSKKRNVCVQRNKGAKKATGLYLIFVDADCRIYKDYLSTVYKTIKRKKAVFLTTYQEPDIRKPVDLFLTQLANYTLEILSLINFQMAPESNFIIKSNLFHEVGGFDEDVVFAEAHDLSLRLWKKKKVKVHIIKKSFIKCSFRRFRKDGHWPIIYKYSFGILHIIFLGKITDSKFNYPMGGNYFEDIKNPPKNILDDFKRAIKKVMKGK